jgi:putative FmdB family regulatory protein
MPTYEYRCNTCGKEFEHFQSMKDDALTHCLCEKSGIVERLISKGSGIIFKGSGFYVNDYKKSSSEPSSTSSTTSDSGTNTSTGSQASTNKTDSPSSSPTPSTTSSSSTPKE